MKISKMVSLLGLVGFVTLQSAEKPSQKPLYYENVTPPPVPPRQSNPPQILPRSPKKAAVDLVEIGNNTTPPPIPPRENAHSLVVTSRSPEFVEVSSINNTWSIPVEDSFSKSSLNVDRLSLDRLPIDSIYEYDVFSGVNPPMRPVKNVFDKNSKQTFSPLVVAKDDEVFSSLPFTESPKNNAITSKRSSSSTENYMNTSPDSKNSLLEKDDLYLTPTANPRALELQTIIQQADEGLKKLEKDLDQVNNEFLVSNGQNIQTGTIEKRVKDTEESLAKLKRIQQSMKDLTKKKNMAQVELDEIREDKK